MSDAFVQIIQSIVYLICFVLSFFSLSALHYEKFLRANHVWQAQVLYWLLAMSLGYLSARFILSLMNL